MTQRPESMCKSLKNVKIYTKHTKGEKSRKPMKKTGARQVFSTQKSTQNIPEESQKRGQNTHMKIIKKQHLTKNGQKRQSTNMDYEV